MVLVVMFGSPETTTGGNALKFYASVRLDVRRVGSLKAGEETIGNRTRVKVVKNKLAAPFRQVEFDIIYGRGINSEGELIDIGVELGIVRKSGSWFAYGEERIGQGRDKASAYVSERPELRERLRGEILNRGAAAVQVVAGASAEA